MNAKQIINELTDEERLILLEYATIRPLRISEYNPFGLELSAASYVIIARHQGDTSGMIDVSKYTESMLDVLSIVWKQSSSEERDGALWRWHERQQGEPPIHRV